MGLTREQRERIAQVLSLFRERYPDFPNMPNRLLDDVESIRQEYQVLIQKAMFPVDNTRLSKGQTEQVSKLIESARYGKFPLSQDQINHVLDISHAERRDQADTLTPEQMRQVSAVVDSTFRRLLTETQKIEAELKEYVDDKIASIPEPVPPPVIDIPKEITKAQRELVEQEMKRQRQAILSMQSAGFGGAGSQVSNTPYGSGWSGAADMAPSQQAIYNKIEALPVGVTQQDVNESINTHTELPSAHHTRYADSEAKAACVSDLIYSSGWATITDIAPSKRAVYDKIQTIQGGSAPDPILGVITETDDFIAASTETGETGALGWSWTNGSIVNGNAEQNHPGIITRRSGVTAAQVASMYLAGAGTTTRFRYDEWTECTFIIACVVTNTDFAVRIGIISDATSNTPVSGVYFERLAADTAWWRVTRAASTQTRNTTSSNVSTSWVKFRILKNGANVEFYIDGVLNGTHSTNIPAAAITLMPFIQVIPSTTTARDLKTDLIQYKLAAMTR